MQNSISYWQHLLLQEIEETSYEKSGLKNPNLADLDKDKDISSWEKKRGSAIEKNIKEDGMDHEVSMANNSIETIIKHAMELKAKLGNDEKDIPAWIQDHISNAANFIGQAAENYHEYGEEDGAEEKTDDEIGDQAIGGEEISLQKMMEKVLGVDKQGYTQNAQATGPFRGASRDMQMSGNLESKKRK